MNVCLASSRMAWRPSMGGHLWVNLNWALGLRDAGATVTILESLHADESVAGGLEKLASLRASMRAVDADFPVVVLLRGEQVERFAGVTCEDAVLLSDVEELAAQTDLFLSLFYALKEDVTAAFARRALIDIDPGLLQMWLHQGAFTIPQYDVYFTIGETVGQAGSKIPETTQDWQYTPPAVHLPSWPVLPRPESAAYTTITNWWASYEILRGESFNNEKRMNFMRYLKLPTLTDVPVELAIYHEEGNYTEIPKLQGRGWRARPAYEVSSTAEAYRGYIQGSFGEFSTAKESCMRLANAWISDRSLCYLASGRPIVVQDTGPSRFLPQSRGMLRFSSPEEAAALLERCEQDYELHAGAARRLAEEHFDAQRCARSVLERAVR